MSDVIQYHNDHGIATLRVNRPQARNALNWAAQEGFAAAVQTAASDPTVRALIITGTGRAFISGGDLRELDQHPEPAAGARLNRVMGQALAQLASLPFPVIGAANGDAAGGGVEVLTACDLRTAVPHARFHLVQIRMGLTSGWGGAARLVHLVGLSRAMDWMLNGRSLSASEMHQHGFLHRLAAEGAEVYPSAHAWAEELCAMPRHATAALKQLLHHAAHNPLPASYQLETELFTDLYGQPANRAAIAGFLGKGKRGDTKKSMN
jgi:enoyl-CoA hydratase/carnithine racemase